MQFLADSLLKPALPIPDGEGEWAAQLTLQFALTARGTRLLRKQQHGPLYVQRPFYPEGPELAHVYLLHPPGGLVSGDNLHNRLQLTAAAQVLCTTPGAGRLYRARSDQRCQQMTNTLQLAANTTLEWLPQESIVFEGAHAKLLTTVELAESARFIGWEITALGLPASSALLETGSLVQRLQVILAGQPLLREQLVLTEQTRALAKAQIGLQQQTVTGLFVCGPFTKTQIAALPLAELQAVAAEAGRPALCGITRLGQFLVGRYLGSCAQQARMMFTNYWQQLRPLLLQRPVCVPAIWAT